MHVEYRHLSLNELVGTIPTELGNLNATMTKLYLHDNKLTGPVPESLTKLSLLKYFQLAGNPGLCFFNTTASAAIRPCSKIDCK
jgi:hypothetical protein